MTTGGPSATSATRRAANSGLRRISPPSSKPNTTKRSSRRVAPSFDGVISSIETHTEIVVSPEDDIEVRRVHITNRSRTRRTIEVTSYAEVVLAPAAADALHPAFSNLFVQTEIIKERHAILCTRRPRSLEEQVPWMFHLMTVRGVSAPEISFETDRMLFIGRSGSVAAPLAMTVPGALSGTEGSVLDPIAAIRHRISIEAGATVTIDMVSGAGETRDAVLHLVDKYQDRAPRGSRVRVDVDAQPGRAPPAQCVGSGFATLWSARQFGYLCQRFVACRAGGSGEKPPRAVRPLGLRNLR